MGDILSFQPKRNTEVPKKRNSSADAVVIIFPGVRYERLTSTRTRVPTANKSKPRPSRH